MKLFRHYKNKFYKYLGTARHTETLQDVVVYECLYDNPDSKVWVRPKEMFFEKIEIDGKTIPRFAETAPRIESTTEVTETEIQKLIPLMKTSFGEWNPNWFYSRLQSHTRFYLSIASIDDKPVGFKLGYELDRTCFYSWVGAVFPEYRGFGVASRLMADQHEWCKKQGYARVQTKTQNRFKAMFILNLKSGFEVIDSYVSDKDGLKIVLEKKLF